MISHKETIKHIIKNANPDQSDLNRIEEELIYLEKNNLFQNLFSLYKKVKQNPQLIGNKNKINSACAYYLGITSQKHDTNNPIHIEKRLTYARVGFPDIDMDFDYEKRHFIIEYLINKYGRDCVGNIGTVQKLQIKAAVRRTIKVLDPENIIQFDENGKRLKDDGDSFGFENKVLKTLPKIMKNDEGELIKTIDDACKQYSEFNSYMKSYPEVYRVAKKMTGKISAYGCLYKDTPVLTNRGWVRIDQINQNKSIKVGYLDIEQKIQYSSDYVAIKTGIKKYYKMKLEDGNFIKVTDEHIVFTNKGCIFFEKIRKNPKEYKVLSIKM